MLLLDINCVGNYLLLFNLSDSHVKTDMSCYTAPLNLILQFIALNVCFSTQLINCTCQFGQPGLFYNTNIIIITGSPFVFIFFSP